MAISALVLIAAGLTEATLAYGDRAALPDGRRASTSTPSIHIAPATDRLTLPVESPAKSSPTPSKLAVTTTAVNLRASPATSAPILQGLKSGTTVTLIGPGDGEWQEVTVLNLSGYIIRTSIAPTP
jgi:uncharacterized protein YgiM (DUF1202 family)